MEVIEELNKIKVNFKFEDEMGDGNARSKRRTLRESYDSMEQGEDAALASAERVMIQNQLLERLEVLNGMQEVELTPNLSTSDEPRLGIYNQKERVERLNAYREKRKQRAFGKVRYALRKRASEGRQRVRGRFAKEDPPSTSQGIADSTSWMQGMSLGARRFSETLRRASAPSAVVREDGEHRGSWSSWLLTNRRKSSASATSKRDPIGSMEFDFVLEHDDEPDRKRITSGSSVMFESVSDPR